MPHYDTGDAAMFALAIILGGLCGISPRSVLWVLSYGGRIRYQLSERSIMFLRIAGGLACLGGLLGLVEWLLGG